MKKIAAIYIPGLGDEMARGQDKVPVFLRLFGIKGYYFPFGWADGTEEFKTKLNELLGLVDELTSQGYKVSLIAASAGASGALNAFAKRRDDIRSLSLICGKVNNLGAIHASYYNKNPKFKSSVKMLPLSLENLSDEERSRVLSIRPSMDPVVPPKDTIVEGARNLKSFTVGHSTSIAFHLTIGLPRIARWIRKNS